MTKRERVIAAIEMKENEQVPSLFSYHFPEEQKTGDACVKAHLDFFRESDADIAKIMNEYLIHAHHDIRTVSDYAAIGPYSIQAGFMQKQLDLTRRILDGCGDDVFTMGTLHGMTASGIHPIETRGVPYETCREMLCSFLREDRNKTVSTLNHICDLLCDLGRAYIEAGVDCVYFASLGGEPGYFTDEEFETVIKPMDMRIMQAVKEAGGYCLLHICKGPLNMQRYAGMDKYADIVNWGVYEAPFSLEEGRKLFPGKCILGGLQSRGGVLSNGTDEEIRAEVHRILDSFGRKGFILGADCTIATDQDMDKLRTAIRAARGE